MNKKIPIIVVVLCFIALACIAAIVQSGWTSTSDPAVARTALGVLSGAQTTNAIISIGAGGVTNNQVLPGNPVVNNNNSAGIFFQVPFGAPGTPRSNGIYSDGSDLWIKVGSGLPAHIGFDFVGSPRFVQDGNNVLDTTYVPQGDDTAYSAVSWNGNDGVPTKNAVRDKFESLSLSGAGPFNANQFSTSASQTNIKSGVALTNFAGYTANGSTNEYHIRGDTAAEMQWTATSGHIPLMRFGVSETSGYVWFNEAQGAFNGVHSGNGNSLTGDDEAYDATGWLGDTTLPTKNAVRNAFETLSGAINPTPSVDSSSYPLFVNSATGAQAVHADPSFVYDPVGQTLTVSNMTVQTFSAVNAFFTNSFFLKTNGFAYFDANGQLQKSNNIFVSLSTNVMGRITPLMFGAVGDGITDDTAAWQATIAAKSNVTWVIEGLNLNYKIAGTISQWSNAVTIQNAKFIKTNITGQLLVGGADNFTIRNCQFYGPGTNNGVSGWTPAASSVGILLTNRPWSPGIYNEGMLIDGCIVQSFDTGGKLSSLERATISRSQFTGNKSYGLWIDQSDSSTFERVVTGVATSEYGATYPDTFFPSNAAPAWISNSVAIHIQGPGYNNRFIQPSGGYAKRAFEAFGPNLIGITLDSAEYEDINNFQDVRTITYWTNVQNITISRPYFARINTNLPTAFNYLFVDCPATTMDIDAGPKYDGSTPQVATFSTGVWGAQNILNPPVKGAFTRRALTNLTSFTGMTNVFLDTISDSGTVTSSAMDQNFTGQNTFSGNINEFRSDFSLGSDAGSHPTRTINTVKESSFWLPTYASAVDAMKGLYYVNVSGHNYAFIGNNQETASWTDLYFSPANGTAATAVNKALMTFSDFSPVVSGGMTLGATQPWGAVTATSFTGTGLGLTGLNPTISLTAGNPSVNSVLTNKSGGPAGWFPVSALSGGSGYDYWNTNAAGAGWWTNRAGMSNNIINAGETLFYLGPKSFLSCYGSSNSKLPGGLYVDNLPAEDTYFFGKVFGGPGLGSHEGDLNAYDAAFNSINVTTDVGVGGNVTANSLVFEGATPDAFETTLTVVDPTADRTVTFQNASGTVAYLTDIGSSSNTSTILYRSTVAIGVTNAASTNTVLNYTIPANTLQGRTIHVVVHGLWHAQNGPSDNLFFEVKLGSTVLWAGLNQSTGLSANARGWRMEFDISDKAGAQVSGGYVYLNGSTGTAAAVGYGQFNAISSGNDNAVYWTGVGSSETETGTLALTVRVGETVADPTNWIQMQQVKVIAE